MEGSVEVYVSDRSKQTTLEIRNAVWSTLREAINGPGTRQLAQFSSPLLDESVGIVGLYFLSHSLQSSDVSNASEESMRSIGPGGSEGVDITVYAALVGVMLFIFGVITLAYLKNQRELDDESEKQKRQDT